VPIERFPDSGADKRVYPRSPVVVREARLISGMEVFFGYGQNVSRSGIFIGTPKQRAPGTMHEIRFRLPGLDLEFHCAARVVWCRPFRADSPFPPGFGLAFVDLSPEDAERIDQWVSLHREPEPSAGQ